MSVEYCHNCDKSIDTDANIEHDVDCPQESSLEASIDTVIYAKPEGVDCPQDTNSTKSLLSQPEGVDSPRCSCPAPCVLHKDTSKAWVKKLDKQLNNLDADKLEELGRGSSKDVCDCGYLKGFHYKGNCPKQYKSPFRKFKPKDFCECGHDHMYYRVRQKGCPRCGCEK